MRALRWILIGIAALFALAAGGIGILIATLDTEALKPRIAAAVEDATGRRLTLAGPIRVGVSLVPTIVAEDVRFANMEGGSRPDMARIGRMTVRIAILPLLSGTVQLRQILLVEPDIVIETDATGRPNWVFSAPRAEPAQQGASVAPTATQPRAAGRNGGAVDLGAIRIQGGQFTYRNGRTGTTQSLTLRRLGIESRRSEGLVRIEGELVFANTVFVLSAETGSLIAAAPGNPWPYRAVLTGAGIEARIEGRLANPGSVEAWGARIDLNIAALAPLQQLVDALAPGIALPPLRDLRLAVALAREDGTIRLGAMTISLGANDLGVLRDGLTVARLDITADGADRPMRVALDAALSGVPITAAGTLGMPSLLMAPAALPLDLAITAGAARVTLAGRIADPIRFAGAAVDVALSLPDPAALAPLLGRPLPALGPLEASARIATGDDGLAGTIRLAALRLAAPAIALAGDLELDNAARPGLRGRLEGERLDLDALRAALAPAAAPSAAPGAVPDNARARAAGPRRVIPETSIPLDALRLFDADLRFSLVALRVNGVAYRDVSGHLRNEDGRLRLSPFALSPPGGRIVGSVTADATAEPPSLHIVARHEGAGIDLGPLLAAYGLPGYASGRMEFDVDLAGRGADTRAFAASAQGHLGLAVPGGRIERNMLAAIPDQLRALLLPPGAAEGGVALRCFALRLPAQTGNLVSEMFFADTGIGRVGGGGRIDLRDETLALRLLPDMRVGPVQVRAPVNIGGTLAAPRFATNSAAAAASGLGSLLGGTQGQALADALGGGGGSSLPDCASALDVARGGRAGAAAPEAEAAAPADPVPQRQQRRDPARGAQDMLRGLFGGGRR